MTGESDDEFGNSVSISGDTIIIGSRYDDIGANLAQGSAYVFVRSRATWFLQQKLIASGGADYDYFGFSVAISGETAVVGAYRDDVGANSNQGSAYVFVRGGATWTQQQKLTASDGAADDGFGYSVAISGDDGRGGSALRRRRRRQRSGLGLRLCPQRRDLDPAAEDHGQRRDDLRLFRLLGGHQRRYGYRWVTV